MFKVEENRTIYLDDKGNIDVACRKIVEAFSFKNKNVRS